MTSYSEKLRDPRWQKKRLEVMARDGFRCLLCGDDKSTLNVNHLKYTGEPWDAPLEHLETLCEKCHGWRTELNLKYQLCHSSDMPAFVERGLSMTPFAESALHFIYDCIVKADAVSAVKASEPDGGKAHELQRVIDYNRGMAVRVVMEGFTPPWDKADKKPSRAPGQYELEMIALEARGIKAGI